ncbi:class F sortase [Candidatus Wolfebacteria bacterium]|nr:class F sortase [Candidatus Wolfebacteria bacterium]
MLPALLHKRLNKRTRILLAVFSVLLIVLGVSMLARTRTATQETNAPVLAEGELAPARVGYTLSESAPVRLSIPKINVDAPFVSLGVDENREIEIPKGYEEVGWYEHGPTPGELGPAIVLGHVDSYEGAAVFYLLGQLEPGDVVDVTRANGTVAHFRVDKLERYLQTDFPTSLVYGDIDHAGLRLITCSGSYDRNLLRYDKNLIVYASLIGADE